MNNKSKLVVRIICLFLALAMGASLIYTFAYSLFMM